MPYKIAIIGQGYVGLPLALAFSKYFCVIGYDINYSRISSLELGIDETREADNSDLQASMDLYKSTRGQKGFHPSCDSSDIVLANVYVVTVPTPVDRFNSPDLRDLKKACETIGKLIVKGDIVIYESTVYPGCTEEECIPILENVSGLKYNVDFYVGYSPERINPGDKINTLETIVKVTSGSTPEIAEEIDQLYKVIIKAGTYKAPSIKVAEASKVIENAQRDVNISFVNELALIFDRMGIDTHEVLEAAGTKFNFLKFKPGLVGGNCISVDPYYLAHKAIQLGYHPEVILAGRKVNDEIPIFIVNKMVKLMIKKRINVSQARILLLGFSFKENCPDTRNTKVARIYQELRSFGLGVDVYDPWVNPEEVKQEYGIKVLSEIDCANVRYEGLILTTAHDDFKNLDIERIVSYPKSVVYDTKGILNKNEINDRL